MADSRDKKRGDEHRGGGGIPTWLRVLAPISNLIRPDGMRKGGKVRAKSMRKKSRSCGR